MIDPKKETLISLKEASSLFPPGRLGKKPHRSTIFRWVVYGVRGVYLEAIPLPAGRATSKEAITRFLHELTKIDERNIRKKTAPSLDRRRKQIASAERELDEMGVK